MTNVVQGDALGSKPHLQYLCTFSAVLDVDIEMKTGWDK
jgi:hypothetical protein